MEKIGTKTVNGLLYPCRQNSNSAVIKKGPLRILYPVIVWKQEPEGTTRK